MTWSAERARKRIEGFQDTTPQVKIERFEEDYLPRRARERALYAAAGVRRPEAPPLYDLPDGAAVIVPDAVHVYVRALSYDDVRLEKGVETPAGHARGLSFLHLLYGAGDRAVEAIGAQRVDHHGARMHAVIAEPAGAANLAARIGQAIALARELTDLAREAAGTIARQQQFPLRFRIGIDAGTCVALNSRRSDEREPVFIGPAANHAAKLAAGDEEGVYMSDRVRGALGLPVAGSLLMEQASRISEQDVFGALRHFGRYDARGTAIRLDRWIEEARTNPTTVLSPSDFKFHEHSPPLRSIKYENLSPAKSIRMDLVSLFADLDEYTAYIDHCMATGCLDTAVRLLHILRCEFNAVVQEDFGGRKVRFIGDCIHAIIAAGRTAVDPATSVQLAAQCAGGLRSSFDLCQEMVEHADRLGLAIGFELGPTPVSRIGIRGPRSVRVASSLATRASERLQQGCGGEHTVIGPNAYAAAPASVRKLFGLSRIVSDLSYDDVASSGAGAGAAAPAGGTSAAILSGTAADAAAAAPARAFHS